MYGATLNLHGYSCQNTVIFGKLKDGTVVNSLDFGMKQLFQLQKRLSKQH